jgi:molybdopterin/thiamine biosynthesis adenylyltransferase
MNNPSKDNIYQRYNRQIIIPEIQAEGQTRLLNAHVGVIGCGGLGASVIPYLVAAGVGKIGLYDRDNVDISNLNRQILFNPDDIGCKKVDKVDEWIYKFSPNTQIKAHSYMILPYNVLTELQQYDLVIDCVDTMHTKYHINDACTALKKPFVHSSCVGYLGQVLAVPTPDSPCLRCLFETIPPACELQSCSTAGILGATCGVIGSLAALEAIKLIASPQYATSGKFISFDFLKAEYTTLNFSKNDDCPACGRSPTIDPTCEADYVS